MNGLQWKTYKKMDVKRGRGKPNHITIKYIMIIFVDEKQERHVMILDVLNVFI